MRNKVPPYTTRSGLQIGCRYDGAPKRIEPLSRDALRLQSALLERRFPTPLWVKLLWRWL